MKTLYCIIGICYAAITLSAQTVNITITAFDTGRYSQTGDHDPSVRNYLTGNVSGTEYAAFFAFNLPDYPSRSSSSSTQTTFSPYGEWMRAPELDKPFDPLEPTSPNIYPYAWQRSRTQTVTLTEWTYNVTGISSASIAFPSSLGTAENGTLSLYSVTNWYILDGGTGHTEIYNDLKGGTVYGSRVFTPQDPSKINQPGFSINLNQSGLDALQTAEGETWIVGAFFNGPDEEYIFGGTNGSNVRLSIALSLELVEKKVTETFSQVYQTQYSLSTDALIPIPEPSHYAIASGILVLGIAHLRRRSKMSS